MYTDTTAANIVQLMKRFSESSNTRLSNLAKVFLEVSLLVMGHYKIFVTQIVSTHNYVRTAVHINVDKPLCDSVTVHVVYTCTCSQISFSHVINKP